ncbi:14994_t:CDS:2 [Funneliformis mosseae]|uniref:14994_t:CDS:1 n=1 Tax=Funneliformis mosseae TaxID=27381 RepID=A0A9N9GD86_FUNMO|nr:14994_t:CDS:2 [Funneliformis mosseae]
MVTFGLQQGHRASCQSDQSDADIISEGGRSIGNGDTSLS